MAAGNYAKRFIAGNARLKSVARTVSGLVVVLVVMLRMI